MIVPLKNAGNRLPLPDMKTNLLLTLSGLLLAMAGCASSSGSKTSAKPDPKAINWSERVGNYTYQQALADLGKPTVTGESADGSIAEWRLSHSPQVSFGLGVGSGSYGRSSAVGVGVGTTMTPPPHGEYLRLQFDKEGKLKEWSRVKY